jgi:hypothetical protein
MSDDQILHSCSPYFLTRPLSEQGPTLLLEMSELAWKAMCNELRREREEVERMRAKLRQGKRR